MIGLSKHFEQQDKAFKWSVGLLFGPLMPVEMHLALKPQQTLR